MAGSLSVCSESIDKETTTCNAKNRVRSANAFMYTLVDESISFFFFSVNQSGSNYSWHGSRNRRKKMCKRRNDIIT